MIAADYISKTLSPAFLDDTGEQLLTMMSIFHVKHLPLIEDNQLIGVVSEDDILNQDINLKLSESEKIWPRAFVTKNDHLFDVLKKLAETNLTVIPVIDDEEKYLGMITQEDMLMTYANSFSFKEPGSILVIETDRINYSLAQISQICESEKAYILSTLLTNEEDSNKIQVTIKLNVQDLSAVISSLRRYDYDIKASFTEETYFDSMKGRYDMLMTYLNV